MTHFHVYVNGLDQRRVVMEEIDAYSALSRRLESTETQGDGKHMSMCRHMPWRNWIDHSWLESGSQLILVTDLLRISIVPGMDNQRWKSHLEAGRAIGSSRLYRTHMWQWERRRHKALQAFQEAWFFQNCWVNPESDGLAGGLLIELNPSAALGTLLTLWKVDCNLLSCKILVTPILQRYQER